MGAGSFPGVKRPGRGVDYPASFIAEVKKKRTTVPLHPIWDFVDFSRVNCTFVNYKHHLSAKRAVQVTLFTGINANIRPIISLNQLIFPTAKSVSVAAQIIMDLARLLNWNAVRSFSSSLMWRPRPSVRLPSVCLIVTSYQRIKRLSASHEIV